MARNREWWVIVYGNLRLGLHDVIGPFDSEERAEAWHLTASPWRSAIAEPRYDAVIMQLHFPEDY